jgi:RNA polymerase sigma factor (sigma-70 family)
MVGARTSSASTMDLYMSEVTRYPLLSTEQMEGIYAQHHLRESVQDVVASHLSQREQEVLRMRFGLDGSENRTLQQIADTLHVSRERVRQIEARALRRLRYARARHELQKIWAQI